VADLYEIVNPSDAYSIAGEREVVCAAVVFLGEGMYGLNDAEGASVLPLFFGPRGEAQLDKFWREQFGHPFGDAIERRREEIAAALETVTIGNRAERARMERVLAAISSPEEREKAKAAWHDERRGSMNDIGAHAAALAKAIRAKGAARVG